MTDDLAAAARALVGLVYQTFGVPLSPKWGPAVGRVEAALAGQAEPGGEAVKDFRDYRPLRTSPETTTDTEIALDDHDAPTRVAATEEAAYIKAIEKAVEARVRTQIADAVERLCPDHSAEHVGDHCDYRHAAAVARQFAEPTGTPKEPTP